jgi:hypothetical protein
MLNPYGVPKIFYIIIVPDLNPGYQYSAPTGLAVLQFKNNLLI